MDTEWLWLEIQ